MGVVTSCDSSGSYGYVSLFCFALFSADLVWGEGVGEEGGGRNECEWVSVPSQFKDNVAIDAAQLYVLL